MSKTDPSSRRTFLKAGALLAAPLAAPAVALGADETKARLRRLEDEAAIRGLHESWLRKVNAGEREAALGETIRSIAPDYVGEPDAIELAADGRSAAGRFSCTVGLEEALAKDSTLGQMAHEQGTGFLYRTERRVLEVDYVKSGTAWRMTNIAFGRRPS